MFFTHGLCAELQRDEACLKQIFFPQRQWNGSINLRGWSLLCQMKGLCFSTEGSNLHPAQSPARTALCCIIYSITYSSEQDTHLRSKLKLQVAGDSSLCFLWTFVLQNQPASAGEIDVGWKRVAGMSVAKGAASGRGGRRGLFKTPQAEDGSYFHFQGWCGEATVLFVCLEL